MRLPAFPIGLLPPLPAAVLVAALLVHRLPELAPRWVSAALLAAGLLALFAARGGSPAAGQRREAILALARFLALLLAAGAWTMLRAGQALELRIAPDQEGVDFVVRGHVAGMPQAFERGERFLFRIERCVGPSAGAAPVDCPEGRDVRLAWYRHFGQAGKVEDGERTGGPPRRPGPQPGERWQLTVRLKRPHGLLNPGAFDSELRALEEGIAATGYVRASRDPAWPNRQLAGRSWRPGPAIEAARTVLRDAILAALAGERADAAGVVAALSIGDQAAIPGAWWETFNRTGVGHLMSISGTRGQLKDCAAGA
jgi:competence protein ComEC